MGDTMKKALITGITGQDGSYLAEFLLGKDYEVHGLQRRSSSPNNARIEHLQGAQENGRGRLHMHQGDLGDGPSLVGLVRAIEPDEIYNLGAMSHVGVSFEAPEYTADVDGIGALRLLEAIRVLGLAHRTRFYQASTSELFGQVRETPQRETTPFYPRSPYAAAKLYAYWITVNYREAYGMYACNGILFNHESPRRGEDFVTRKITRSLANIAQGLEAMLHLGNLDAQRDWGHARDYVEMQWLMLQQDKPDDFVIASGRQHSVREFVDIAARELGIGIRWEGSGLEERGIVAAVDREACDGVHVGQALVSVDPACFRPAEVETLLGDAGKARERLGWKPRTDFREMVSEMVAHDLAQARRARLLKAQG